MLGEPEPGRTDRRPRPLADRPAKRPGRTRTGRRGSPFAGRGKESGLRRPGPRSACTRWGPVCSAPVTPLAESVLRQAQERHPRDVWINYVLASALDKPGRRDEAIRFYTAARAIRPETAHALAHALEKRADHDEAIAVFRDLRGLRPGDAQHLVCLGYALKATGRTREAEQAFEAAIIAGREEVRLNPSSAFARFNLGRAPLNKGQLDEAIACYRKSSELARHGHGPQQPGQCAGGAGWTRPSPGTGGPSSSTRSSALPAPTWADACTRACSTRPSPAAGRPSRSPRGSSRPTSPSPPFCAISSGITTRPSFASARPSSSTRSPPWPRTTWAKR